MPRLIHVPYIILTLCVVLIGCLEAVEATPDDHQSVGNLSLIYKIRDLNLEEADLRGALQEYQWMGRRTVGPEISRIVAGKPIPLATVERLESTEDASDVFLEFIRKLPLPETDVFPFDFSPLNAWKFHGTWHVALEQTYQGAPVFGSRVDGKITEDGFLTALSMRLFPTDHVNLSFALSESSAMKSLSDDPTARIGFSRRILYPLIKEKTLELRSAWQLRIITDQADLRPAGVVNALTGEILLRYNDVAFDAISGNVRGLVLPAYWDDDPEEWVQEYQWIDVVNTDTIYTDILGDYSLSGLAPGPHPVMGRLQGLYVNVNNDDGPDAQYLGVAYTATPLDWLWDYGLARQDEANMYGHVNVVHDFFKSLDPDFDDLDFPLPATVGYGTGYENAFWNGSGIFFGTGGGTFRNFALFCDVIYHEYTHGVTDMIYPPGLLPYIDQPGAMNEGWSDYFACTITDEPLIGEGGLYYSGQVMRDLDNTLKYPDDWAGEVHADGRIFGGALWDLREALGASLADSLIHFAKYAYAELWEDYFLDVLILDDDDGDLTNGGPHHPEIYQAFGIHGIGPGAEPVLAIYPTEISEDGTGGSQGNGDGFFDPGEILSMTFSVTDLRYLYPPPAEDVTVTVSSDDADLDLNPLSFSLGDIQAGQTVQAPESLMIAVAAQANLSFSKIFFNISANGGSYQITDSVEVIIGHPSILLVDDDGGDDYQQYLDNSLRQLNQVFSLYDVSSEGPVSLDYLIQFQVAVWMTGDQSTNTLTLSDQATLASFLDAGHDLLLTGQNLVEDVGETDFFANYLKSEPVSGSVSDFSLDGVPGDPISDSIWVMIIGAGAGNNQTSPGAISALPGAMEIFHYQNDPSHRPAAVRFDSGTYKAVTFVFGLEAVSGLGGSAPCSEVLSSIMDWFGFSVAIQPEPQTEPLPHEYLLGKPFPNPFNAQFSVPLSLPQFSNVKVKIYNLRGQSVAAIFEGSLEAGNHFIPCDAAQLSSGIYFLRLAVRGETDAQLIEQTAKLVLLK